MAAITGVVLVALLAGIFFLFRVMWRMGQQPSTSERMRHTSQDRHPRGRRASGLD
jgi:hypothetical protein